MLVIRVVSHSGEPPASPLEAAFGEAGGDIGRGAQCTLVLPDPERRLSRRHALVTARDGRHYIRRLGSGVALAVDDRLLAVEAEQELADGACIRLGPYVLQAVERDEQVVPAVPVEAPQRQPAAACDLSAGDVDLLLEDVAEVPSTAQAALQALYDGLGIDAPAVPDAGQARLVGQLLREALQGTLELLAARQASKRELGAGATRLQVRENNPLKFAPDVDSALTRLLQPPQRGFLNASQALSEAYADLCAHEVAVVAGLRAALDDLFARFHPSAIEQSLGDAGAGGWLRSQQQARLWQHYVAMHERLQRDLDDEVDTPAVRAFLKAYGAQLSELARGAQERGGGR